MTELLRKSGHHGGFLEPFAVSTRSSPCARGPLRKSMRGTRLFEAPAPCGVTTAPDIFDPFDVRSVASCMRPTQGRLRSSWSRTWSLSHHLASKRVTLGG